MLVFIVALNPRSRRRPRPSGALMARRAIAAERVPEAGELSEGKNYFCDARANGGSIDERTGAPDRVTGPVALSGRRDSRVPAEGRTDCEPLGVTRVGNKPYEPWAGPASWISRREKKATGRRPVREEPVSKQHRFINKHQIVTSTG